MRRITIQYVAGKKYVATEYVPNLPPQSPPRTSYHISGHAAPLGLAAVTNGIDTWMADPITGSYGYDVPVGWSGTTTELNWITSPDSYVYTSVAADYTNQDFTVAAPVMQGSEDFLSWPGWAFTEPDRWIVSAKNPLSLTFSDTGTYPGGTFFDFFATGTYYHVRGVTAASDDATRVSNDVQSTAPLPPVHTIQGTVTNAIGGDLKAGVHIEFEAVGTVISNGSNGYSETVNDGYSGTATPHATGGAFTPQVRVYVNVTTALFNQDYVFTPDFFLISGTVTQDNSVPLSIPIITNTGTVTSSASGSYGYLVQSGSNATTQPYWITTPGSYAYSGVSGDHTNQNFTVPTPVLTYDTSTGTLHWAWNGSLAEPYEWEIQQFVGTWGTWDYVNGASRVYRVQDFGKPYRIQGVDTGASQITPHSNGVSTPGPKLLISGTVTDQRYSGTGFAATIVFTGGGGGTLVSDATTGSYGFLAPFDYNGVATPSYGVSGTFNPDSRLYTFIESPQLNQNYEFWDAIPTPPPTDCPVPTGLVLITDLPTPNDVSRSVNDPVNNLLWYLDNSFDQVYYVDVYGGTYAGSIAIPGGGQESIVYDAVSAKVVVMTNTGSIYVIDPAAKTATIVPGIEMQSPSFHLLAADDAGTVYAVDNRNVVNGSIYAVNPATATLIKSTKLTVVTDSICWASNINKLVINQGDLGAPSFVLFDPATETFQSSVITNPTTFRYENFYIPSLGHMLESYAGGQPTAVIDIANGTNATVIATIPPARVSNATIDTCNDRLFVTRGSFEIYEISLDGSYTVFNEFNDNGNGISPASLSHSRLTNLVYYADYSDGTIHTVQATRHSGSIGGMIWTVDQGFTPDTAGGFASAQGGTAWFSGSAVGEDNTPDQTYNPQLDAFFVNLDAPYAATMMTVWHGSIQDSGTIDDPSQFQMFMQIDTTGTTVSVNGTNGQFSGTTFVFGTIPTGEVFINFDMFCLAGGNFSSSPSNTFVSLTGTTYITPLSPP